MSTRCRFLQMTAFALEARIAYSLAVGVLLLMTEIPALADVRLPAILSDHMLLQQHAPVRIWGRADPHEKIRVHFADQSPTVTADGDGRWSAWLKDLSPDFHGELTIDGKNHLVLQDVLVGEVWLASGQSNMETPLTTILNAHAVIAAATDPQLRLFHVEHALSAAAPAEDVRGKWQLCDPASARGFSAAAYFFGQRLRKARKVPVGLIESAFGGTPVEAWLSKDALTYDALAAFANTEWAATLAHMPETMADYNKKVAVWKAGASAANREAFDAGRGGEGAPAKPRGTGSQNEPAALYNAMIAPLTRYAIKGILWNQGESDNDMPQQAFYYRDMFVSMIRDWRTAWGEGDIPFLFVQLSRVSSRLFSSLRESQSRALELANTGMAVTADLGMLNDVHYPNKEPQGNRLFLLAQKIAYGEDVVANGPRIRQIATEGNSLRLWFDGVDGGLVIHASDVPKYAPLASNTPPSFAANGKAVVMSAPSADDVKNAFQIAGSDDHFSPADIKVEGSTLVLSSPSVSSPTQVCYAFENSIPATVLWNGAGLPASPFRIAVEPRKKPNCPRAGR